MRSRHWGHKPLCRVAFSVPTIGASSPFLFGAHRSVFCAFAASQRLLCICCIAAASVHLLHCSVFCGAASSSVQTSASLHPSRSAPCQQHLPDGSPPQRPRPAISSRWLSAAAPPASNKPHPAEKSTPVWLAIWRTWAGFANSQHRDAAYAASNNICAHFPLLPQRVAAQTDANLSAHLRRLPTPPPYLRQMRLSPGRGAGVGWQMMLLVVRVAVPANHRARESLF